MALIFPPNIYASGGFNFRTYKMGVAPILSVGLNFNFLSGSLDDSLTFARASTASVFTSSGVLSSAAIDTPRFDYNPSTLALKGLLLEEQRQNHLYPSTLVGACSVQRATVGNAAGITSPDGATAAYFNDTETWGTHDAFPSVTFSWVQDTVYTSSIYAKAGAQSVLQLRFSTTISGTIFANYDLSGSGAIGSYTGCTPSIENVGNGWFRCVLTVTSPVTAVNTTLVFTLTNNSTTAGYKPSYTGVGNGVYLWGGQHETGSKASSHIPTTTTVVTRAEEALTFTVPSGVNVLRYVFDDDSTQDVSVSAGTYTIPTNLNRAWIKSIAGV
ncbi:MAG: hypothetical protein WC521_02745 [Bdellovibrionales bacterium]|jgi:hypothetical protein